MKIEESIFLDTNLLVRSTVPTAPFNEQARALVEKLWSEDKTLWVSRQVLCEYLAVLSRPQTFSKVVPPEILLSAIDYFQTRFNVADETKAVTTNLLALIKSLPIGGKQIHDANIVATMQAYTVPQLLTYNTDDFERFKGQVSILDAADAARELGL